MLPTHKGTEHKPRLQMARPGQQLWESDCALRLNVSYSYTPARRQARGDCHCVMFISWTTAPSGRICVLEEW